MQRKYMIIPVLAAAALLAVWAGLAFRSNASAQITKGFASPINGGCYIAAENQCRLHVDPFTININDGAGARLERFELFANGSLIYSFRTDVSNPPAADYSPSPVALDFAAECGKTYYMNLVAKDSTDANPLNYGQTAEFSCPAGVPPGQ